MEDFQKEGVDPKEKQQEEELLKETPADEVRNSIVEKYGLNEEVDDELIKKLVEDRIESRKTLSTAIRQKIEHRTKRTEAEEKIARTEQKKEEKPQPQPKAEENDLDKILDQKLEERELQSLDISDELKRELKTYVKAGGLTVKQALQSEYFKFLKQQEEEKQKVDEAAIGGKRRAPSRQEFDAENPPKVDMNTEEGRKTWEDYKKFLASK